MARLNTIPVRITVGFFVETDKLLLKFIRKLKGPRIAKKSFKRRKKLEYSHFSISKLTTKLHSLNQYDIGTRRDI